MCLGAFVHAGVPLKYLTEKLEQLGIQHEYSLWAERVLRQGQQATKVYVERTADVSPKQEKLSTPDAVSPSLSDHSHAHLYPHHSPAHHQHLHEKHEKTAAPPTKEPPTEDSRSLHAHASHAHGRGLREIEQLIQSANLPEQAEAWSLAIFRRLAEAEGAVHGISPEQVHFHEVGATDAIVDIVGTCLALDWLKIDALYCSPLPTGGGLVRAAHGLLPVPAPAVLKLWEMRQVPIYSNGIDRELVTPTGAAIITTLVAEFGAPPRMILETIGLGAGSRELSIPNILRLWIGTGQQKQEGHFHEVLGQAQPTLPEAQSTSSETINETITVLETQIDDLNPQAIGYVLEELLAAGALDVFTQAIGMKKSRPGILLTVICRPVQVEVCEAILFRETTTLGIRRSYQQRSVLHRSIQSVRTPYGTVQIKVARWREGGVVINVQPEYEDCACLARQTQTPWQEIHRSAVAAWYEHNDSGANPLE